MARRPLDDFDEKPEENISKRELEAKKLKEQIKGLELKNKVLESKIEEKKETRGRPERYSKEFHPKIALLFYGEGGIDRDFAKFLGVTEPTINTWKKKHKEFKKAITEAKLNPDLKVEAALYSSAVHEGSNTAQIFWLKNRRPERWREKQSIELTGADGGPVELSHSEKKERIRELLDKRDSE